MMIHELLRHVAQLDNPGLPVVDANQQTIGRILDTAFSIMGGVAVLIIALAGYKYILSSGKPESAAKAKQTIIYAAVGLAVCVTAMSIVTVIVGRLF